MDSMTHLLWIPRSRSELPTDLGDKTMFSYSVECRFLWILRCIFHENRAFLWIVWRTSMDSTAQFLWILRRAFLVELTKTGLSMDSMTHFPWILRRTSYGFCNALSMDSTAHFIAQTPTPSRVISPPFFSFFPFFLLFISFVYPRLLLAP